MKRHYIYLPVIEVPLDDASEVPGSPLNTPVEDIMASEARSTVIHRLPNRRFQMVFLLLEYGFTDREIAMAMRMNHRTIQNIKYSIKRTYYTLRVKTGV